MKWEESDESTSRSDKGFRAILSEKGWYVTDIRGDCLTDCSGVPFFSQLDSAKHFAQSMYMAAKTNYDREIRRQGKPATEDRQS